MFTAFKNRVKRMVSDCKAACSFMFGLGFSVAMAFPALASGGDSPSEAADISSFLDTSSTLFAWILDEMGNLISFVMANPFLAVGLSLFIVGAVIAFFVRIKMSV